MVFNHELNVMIGRGQTGSSKGVVISTLNKQITVQCHNEFSQIDLLYSLALAKEKSCYLYKKSKPKLNESFAPRRKETFCKFHIDGENYFKAVYQKIKIA